MFKLKREWRDISAEEYHKTPGLSSTGLRCFARQGQLEFYVRHVAATKTLKDTEDMKEGRAFHKAMEKPDQWSDFYATLPNTVPDDELAQSVNLELRGGGGETAMVVAGKGKKKAESKAAELIVGEEWDWKLKSHRQYRDAFAAQSAKNGKELLAAEQLETVKRQVEAVWDNQACRQYLEAKDLNVEMACFATDDKLPFTLKALTDLLLPRTVIDFKKTRERHPKDFIRAAIHRYGYDWQGAYYCLVTGRQEFRVISVTDEYPFEANCFHLPKDRLAHLRDEVIPKHILTLSEIWQGALVSTSVDSQGIPLDYHSTDWGAEMPLDLRYCEGVQFEGDDA